MVKLASTLPKELEQNGLEQNTRHLIAAYTSQDTIPVIGLIHTKDCHDTEAFERVPRVELVAIEGAFNEVDAEQVRALLIRLHDDRVRHVKQPLDLPDQDDFGGAMLAIDQAEIVDADVVDDENEED
ncbi:hypothetical protein [Microbacterium sp. KR10-403]|uniref:hypothetical protein n=1 Tax=Microbacterium sp. KR10-403 TaxID=3158581 RepID=UPI0032E3DF4A